MFPLRSFSLVHQITEFDKIVMVVLTLSSKFLNSGVCSCVCHRYGRFAYLRYSRFIKLRNITKLYWFFLLTPSSGSGKLRCVCSYLSHLYGRFAYLRRPQFMELRNLTKIITLLSFNSLSLLDLEISRVGESRVSINGMDVSFTFVFLS